MPQATIDIFLQPGEIYFGGSDTRIRTLLGSCVAFTVWHQSRRIGGMCHYLLPSRGRKPAGALDGRYADEALPLLLQEVARAGTHPREYQVKLFGGGTMFIAPRPLRSGASVAERNIQKGRELLRQHGFTALAEQLGGHGHRDIIFDVSSGDVWVRKHALRAPTTTDQSGERT
jgi:chemotaxis protein CheD